LPRILKKFTSTYRSKYTTRGITVQEKMAPRDGKMDASNKIFIATEIFLFDFELSIGGLCQKIRADKLF